MFQVYRNYLISITRALVLVGVVTLVPSFLSGCAPTSAQKCEGTYIGASSFHNAWGVAFDAKYVFNDSTVNIYVASKPIQEVNDAWHDVMKNASTTYTDHAVQVDWSNCTKDSACGRDGTFNANSEVFNIESDGKVLRSATGSVVLVKQPTQ